MIFKQLQPSVASVQMLAGAAPVVGILQAELTVEFLKANTSGWFLKTLDPGDWIDLGGGFYHLKLDPADVDVPGPGLLRLKVTPVLGPAADTKVFQIDVVTRTADEVQPPSMCQLFGQLVQADGTPATEKDIYVRVVDFPFSAGNVLATTDQAYTRSNHVGQFAINLMRLSTVMIEIPTSGVRKQFVVPDQPTLSLVDALNI